MKDGFDFSIVPVCDDWGNIDGYEGYLKDAQADGHTTLITFEDSTPRQVLDRSITYIENRIEELTGFRDTLKAMINEE